LRNLEFTLPAKRYGGKTIDDEALPLSLKSPAKLLALSEKTQLAQSRSYTDLKTHSTTTNETSSDLGTSVTDGHINHPQRPSKSQLRRRSTLNWDTSPKQRQRNLQDAIARRTADVFFTLHVSGVENLVYVSEVAERTTNPNFRFFDLSTCCPAVTRSNHMVVKFWARPLSEQRWQYLVELSVNLCSLQYVGKYLEDYHRPLPENCVLFHLDEGIYTSFLDPPAQRSPDISSLPSISTNSTQTEPTSSYDALMCLSTLDTCIQDAIAEREKLTSEINALIDTSRDSFFCSDDLAAANDSYSTVKRAVASERKQIKSVVAKVYDMRANLEARRKAIAAGREAQTRAKEHINEASQNLPSSQAIHNQTLHDITGQRRRICETLLTIYPIDPIPYRSLAFTIRDLALPNSDFSSLKDSTTPDTISAALGHTAHLTHLLSFYLSIPLPYPIQPRSSTSLIGATAGNRTFPLYIKGSIFYRFEYGVFLLNKDIECLANRLGLRVLDIRQTLPNLKLVLVSNTGGKGDAPGRKGGGVRGLLTRDVGSRAHSVHSANGGAGEALRRHLVEDMAA